MNEDKYFVNNKVFKEFLKKPFIRLKKKNRNEQLNFVI